MNLFNFFKLREIFLLLSLVFLSSYLFSQHPKVFVEAEKISELNISKLSVTLDSAARNKKLPFEIIKQIDFNREGKPVLDIGYTSDIYYIHNSIKYTYRQDSVILIKADSAINPPAIDEGPPIVKKEIHIYLDGRIKKKIKYNFRDQYTKVFKYDKTGKIQEVSDYANKVLQGIANYKYDKNQRLIKIIKTNLYTAKEIHYKYEEDEEGKTLKENPSKTSPKSRITEEILINSKGQITKITEYIRQGEVWKITYFKYDDHGLLTSEEAYDGGRIFAYRFLTKYEIRK